MGFFTGKIEELYDKKIPAIGLSIFRIFYGIILFIEVWELYYYRHLIFDTIPYIFPTENSYELVFIVWLILIGCIILGVFSRTSTIINYVLTLITFSVFKDFEYHLDYSLIGINFLLMFIPISQSFSIDRLIEKLKYSNNEFDYIPSNKVSVINYYILIFLGLGLVYFDSIFWKFGSASWLAGLGVWMPASVPQLTWLDLSFLLNVKWLVLFLGYLTLIFELAFLFLFPIKQARIPILIIGIGFHLGIYFSFPIPWFALGIVTIYFLIVPVSWYKFLFDKVRFKKPKVIALYNQTSWLSNRSRIIIQHLDIFNAIRFRNLQTYGSKYDSLSKYSIEDLNQNFYCINRKRNVFRGAKAYLLIFQNLWLFFPLNLILKLPIFKNIGLYIFDKLSNSEEPSEIAKSPILKNTDDVILFNDYTWKSIRVRICASFVAICIFMQILNVSIHSLVGIQTSRYLGMESIRGSIQQKAEPTRDLFKKVFGITSHAVFIDAIHYNNYNHIIAVVYIKENGEEVWLPITNQNGQVENLANGRRWAKWGFRTNSPYVNSTKLFLGIRSFTAFWATENNIPLTNANFKIKVKKIDLPTKWEKDFLRKQMNQPWIEAGEAKWTNNQFTINVPNIETL